MRFEVREAKPGDYDALHRVWSWVYGNRSPNEEELARKPDPEDAWYAGVLEGEVVAAARAIGFTAWRDGADLPCAGVAAVGVLPEARHRKLGSRLIEGMLPLMRERGWLVSSLYGFREPFYRRQGYATCGWRTKIKCPVDRLPPLTHDLPVRRIEPENAHELNAVYEPFRKLFNGSSKRDERLWKRALGREPKGGMYIIGEPPVAFCFVEKGDFFQTVTVHECGWVDNAGHEALLAFLRALGINQHFVEWREPPNSPFVWKHYDEWITYGVREPSMFRVLDVPGALEALKPQGSGEFLLDLRDPLLPENDGPYRVKYSPEGVEVEEEGESDFVMDIQQFSQALMGSPSLDELAELKAIEVSDPNGLRSAMGLLTPRAVCQMDFY